MLLTARSDRVRVRSSLVPKLFGRVPPLPSRSFTPWSTTAEVRCIEFLYLYVRVLICVSDEVSALVLDFGTSSLRAGYAGDDAPKAIVPTAFGFVEEAEASNGDVSMGDATAAEGEQPQAPPKPKVKLHIGQNGPSLWRAGMQVGNPMHDALGMYLCHLCCSSCLPRRHSQSRTLTPYLRS